MTNLEAVELALSALVNGKRLTVALRDVYEAGYREGDLDRQRIQASVVKPERKARKNRSKR